MKAANRSLLILLISLLIAPIVGHAQTAYVFDLPEQPLAESLRAVGRQTSTNVMFEPRLVKGVAAPALRAQVPVMEAIRLLLARTKLVALQTGNDSILVQDAVDEAASGGSQAATDDQAALPLEEIIVTAQKRDERLQEVPMAISALTATDLQARGAATLKDVQFSVPGLLLVEPGIGRELAQMRGIATISGRPTVGIYLNDMPVNTVNMGQGLSVPLIDMARVEVLRGPQGTLYGEGSMGGTIKYITAAPDLKEFGGSVEATYSLVEDGDPTSSAIGVANLPIVSDKLGLRVAAAYEQLPGWIDNTVTGAQDANEGTAKTVRATLLFEPSDAMSFSLMYLRQRSQLDSVNLALADRTIDYPIATPMSDEYDLFNFVATFDLGFASLLSSTGYIERSNVSLSDQSGYLPLLGLPPGFADAVVLNSIGDFDVRTQEIRLTSTDDGRLRWTLGGYYRDSREINTADITTVPTPLPFEFISYDLRAETEAWAAFGEATYRVVSNLEATLGLRYVRERVSVHDSVYQLGPSPDHIDSEPFDSVNPRFNLKYIAPSAIYYLNVAKGFRGGGFNNVPGAPADFDPDNLWSYEIGTKQSLLDRRLALEASVYYNQWRDVQVQVSLPGSPFFYVANSGEASGPGVELQLSGRVTDGITLGGTVGYNDMEYDTTTLDKRKGDPADFASPLTYSLFADGRFHWSQSLPGFVRIDFQHADPYVIRLRSFGIDTRNDDQDYLNLRVGLQVHAVELELFGSNLLDENARVQPAFGNQTRPVFSTPRAIGVRTRARF